MLKEERTGRNEEEMPAKNRIEEGKKQEPEKDMFLISETAKLVGVESHVLRYWEEELKLPIRRNDLGHRYYTCLLYTSTWFRGIVIRRFSGDVWPAGKVWAGSDYG